MRSLVLFLLFVLHFHSIQGNTEKVIFVAPSNLQIPVEHPTLEDLMLETLSPLRWSLRTQIQAEFPTNSAKFGQSSWYLLQGLQEGQRYEVRICWAATHPTSFRLDTYDLPTVFETPELITSLAQYSETHQPDFLGIDKQDPSIFQAGKKVSHRSDGISSTLFLQVLAAADYYTTNKTLMENVPWVHVDIILDPFILNIFPRSLIPTAIYLIILAAGGWYLASFINRWVQLMSKHDTEKKKA